MERSGHDPDLAALASGLDPTFNVRMNEGPSPPVSPSASTSAPRPVPASVISDSAPRSQAESRPEPADVALSLSGSDRKFLAGSAAVILVLMGVYLVRARSERPAGIEIVRPPENELALRLDVNTATWVEWMQMEGIGETMARNIVADREANGPFRSIEDLSRVRGIGDAIMTRLRPRLQCRDCSPDAAPGK